MKNIFYIFIILVLTSCKNSIKSDEPKKIVITDTVATREISAHKYGIIKKSNPFKINGIECYWERTDGLTLGDSMYLMKLKDFKTKRVLLSDDECCVKYGVGFYSIDHFLDVNFDGFKDFLITNNYGESVESEQTEIYLFDNKTKQFVLSDLGDNKIETDGVKRRLITHSFGRTSELITTYYFNKSGKIKYTESVNKYSRYVDSIEFQVKFTEYEKVVNGKVVERKKDSIIYTGH